MQLSSGFSNISKFSPYILPHSVLHFIDAETHTEDYTHISSLGKDLRASASSPCISLASFSMFSCSWTRAESSCCSARDHRFSVLSACSTNSWAAWGGGEGVRGRGERGEGEKANPLFNFAHVKHYSFLCPGRIRDTILGCPNRIRDTFSVPR